MQKSPQQTTPLQWAVLFGTAGLLIGLDQLCKALIVANLELYESWIPVPALSKVFEITYTYNSGAAFGLFRSAGNLFMLVAFIAAGVIVYYYRQIEGNTWLLRIALGLQLGGALGNAVDRIFRGHVVDFLHVFYKPAGFDYPVFNFSDSGIVVGVILLIILLGRSSESQAQNTEEKPAAPADREV